ncbi:TRAP transporter small permease [Ruegeria arenilitoris]|uniref:TRAP transporter small permease n=1 Tax=Ruegeria arenilitoris TaxID=1173585 RepID=UPI001480E331|nr:TRAP transporter small permease subunit [Ruegeria arenilitoris]
MTPETTGITAFERGFLLILKSAMIFFALSLAILMFVTVIMRYGMSNPFLAIEEASILLGIWLYFVSASYVTGTRAHICGGALHLVVKNEKKKNYVRLMTSLICLGVTLVALYYASQYGWFTFERGRKSTYLQWPRSIWVASMVFGFAVMALFFLLQTMRDAMKIRDFNEQNVMGES